MTMRDDTLNPAPSQSPNAAGDPGMQPRQATDAGGQRPSSSSAADVRSASAGAAGQITVSSTLIDAVMDVDAARDNGGLQLQEALVRMHAELAPLIAGPAPAVGDADNVQPTGDTAYAPADTAADTWSKETSPQATRD
jgi:hypothetical protein